MTGLFFGIFVVRVVDIRYNREEILKAVYPDAEIFVDAGCCAGVTPEIYRAALQAMKVCQMDVIGE